MSAVYLNPETPNDLHKKLHRFLPSSAQSVEDDEFVVISSDDEKEVDESALPASQLKQS